MATTTQTKPPVEMTTPALVREYAASRVAWARGENSTAEAHDRHVSVCTELRNRGVLD